MAGRIEESRPPVIVNLHVPMVQLCKRTQPPNFKLHVGGMVEDQLNPTVPEQKIVPSSDIAVNFLDQGDRLF